MIIGLSGTNSSGKDTVAEYFKEHGFFVVSLSDMIRELMKKDGVEINRENLITFANDLEEKLGQGFLAKSVIKTYGQKENLLISSIRKSAEIDYLKTLPGFIFIFVDAPLELRHRRALLRQREGEEKLTFEAFKAQEEIESNGTSSQNLRLCKTRADYLIINDSDLESLNGKIKHLFVKIAKLS